MNNAAEFSIGLIKWIEILYMTKRPGEFTRAVLIRGEVEGENFIFINVNTITMPMNLYVLKYDVSLIILNNNKNSLGYKIKKIFKLSTIVNSRLYTVGDVC